MANLPQAVAGQPPLQFQGYNDADFDRNVTQLQNACIARHRINGALSKHLVIMASIVAAVWAGFVYASGAIAFGASLAVFCVLASLREEVRDQTYANFAEALHGDGFKQFLRVRNYALSIVHIPQMYDEFTRTPIVRLLNPQAPVPRNA